MDKNFWMQRWENNDIGFHENEANPTLVRHFNALSLEQNSRVFIPLCGKTRDIAWLLSKGHRVAGAELIEKAVTQLFEELGTKPDITAAGGVKHYRAKDIDIFAGDIFQLNRKTLGAVDAVYDRAALVALPEDMRIRYTAHLTELTDKAPQLLLSFEYDQAQMEGPPFSVSNAEVKQHYQKSYALNLLASTDIPGGLKGKCAAKENVWICKRLPFLK